MPAKLYSGKYFPQFISAAHSILFHRPIPSLPGLPATYRPRQDPTTINLRYGIRVPMLTEMPTAKTATANLFPTWKYGAGHIEPLELDQAESSLAVADELPSHYAT